MRLERKKIENPENNQAIGCSKGGLSTKIHTSCDSLGNPTGFYLTAGQNHDLMVADALMNHLQKAKRVLSDKACDADKYMRDKLIENGSIAVIP